MPWLLANTKFDMARMNPNVYRVERPISSVSFADAEGTVASSSKINEPFRRAVERRTGVARMAHSAPDD